MKRLFGQILFVAGVGVTSVAVTPACVENDQSIFVRQVQAPPQNRQNGQCVFTPDATQPFLPQGTLDVGAGFPYTANLLVGSQLAPRGEQLNLRAESNRAHINGAEVRISNPDGTTVSEFTSVTSGFVDPGQNNQASFGIARLTLIDNATIAKLNVQTNAQRLVIANVKVFGQTLGGVDLEAGEFQFPIRVCRGCLIDFSRGDDPASGDRDCKLPLVTAGGADAVVIPCSPGQDEVTPCQMCGTLFCQGLEP